MENMGMEMITCPKCNYRFDKDQNPPFSPVTTSIASPALTAQEIAKASYEHKIKVGKPTLEKPAKQVTSIRQKLPPSPSAWMLKNIDRTLQLQRRRRQEQGACLEVERQPHRQAAVANEGGGKPPRGGCGDARGGKPRRGGNAAEA